MSEQRLFLRKKVPLPIPIELLPGKEMWLHDIGEGGLSVSGSSRVEPGTATFFSFQFPDATSIIEASGVVAWCDGAGRVGIRFTRIKADSSAVLKRWLKSEDKLSSPGAEQTLAEPQRAGIDSDAAVFRQEIARGDLDFSGALDHLVESMKDCTRASGAAIALQDHDSVICRASSGSAPPTGTPLNIDNTVTGECYRSGNIVSVTDTEKDARVDAELCRRLELRSVLIVPIAAAEQVVGILEVFSPLPGNFEGGDVLLLGSIAEVVAEIYGAQQRKPSPPTPVAAQPTPFLVSERGEPVLQGIDSPTQAKEESNSTPIRVQSSAVPSSDEEMKAVDETRSETRDTSQSVSSHTPNNSEDERNDAHENRWKPRNYLLLMTGLSVLGIGLGDVVDWHMTSRLVRSHEQPAAATKGQSTPALVASDPKPFDDESASASSAVDPALKTRSSLVSVPVKKTVGAKFENSSLTLKSPTQGAESSSPSESSQSVAALSPSKAVSITGSVSKMDPRTSSQLTPAKLLYRVDPVVPDFAKSAGVDGTVLLSAVIGTDGKLKDVKFVSGDRALAIEAFRAVRDWRYRPYLLNGKPIEAETRIVMNFTP